MPDRRNQEVDFQAVGEPAPSRRCYYLICWSHHFAFFTETPHMSFPMLHWKSTVVGVTDCWSSFEERGIPDYSRSSGWVRHRRLKVPETSLQTRVHPRAADQFESVAQGPAAGFRRTATKSGRCHRRPCRAALAR